MLPAVLAMSSALWAPDCLSEDELMCWCRRLDTTEETSEEMRATKGPMTCRAAPRRLDTTEEISEEMWATHDLQGCPQA
eukprot:1156777-Pelagomonas_calceolata.AAC.11